MNKDMFWRIRCALSYLLSCLLAVRCLQVGVTCGHCSTAVQAHTCRQEPPWTADSGAGAASPAQPCPRGYPWSAEIGMGLVFQELEPRRTGWSWLPFLTDSCLHCLWTAKCRICRYHCLKFLCYSPEKRTLTCATLDWTKESRQWWAYSKSITHGCFNTERKLPQDPALELHNKTVRKMPCCPSLLGWSKGGCWPLLCVPCGVCWGGWRGWAVPASSGCVLVGAVREDALKTRFSGTPILFQVLHWPVSSPVLSTNLVILFTCQRSVNLTQWWILCWMSVMCLLRPNSAKVVGLS